MKLTLLSLLLGAVIVLSGCSATSPDDVAYNQRSQMLSAQRDSITSIETEIHRIREGCGGDMSKWSADTITLYKKWQDELLVRYQEREKLIKMLSGDSMSEMSR